MKIAIKIGSHGYRMFNVRIVWIASCSVFAYTKYLFLRNDSVTLLYLSFNVHNN